MHRSTRMVHDRRDSRFAAGWLLAVCLMLALTSVTQSQSNDGRPLHLYLLAGQSNMAGRGAIAQEDTTIHPRVYALNEEMVWDYASEPLHFDKPKIPGVGPGFAFGKAMADLDSSVVIGLIPAAVGGSPIETWMPGATHSQTGSRPYDDALSWTFRVMALHHGILKGIIWHQGESDRTMSTEEYQEALTDLIARFRKDFGIADLPFVAARLAAYYVVRNPEAGSINEAISRIPAVVPHTAVVRSDGLEHRGDGVHLDASSARILGRRYAEAMHALQLEAADSPRN